MKLPWVVAIAFGIGCGGSKAKPKPEPPAPKPVVAPVAADAKCTGDVAKLKTWLEDLVADGSAPLTVGNVHLVKLDGEAVKPLASAPVVTITATEITFQGQMVATTTTKAAALTKAVRAALASKGPDFLYVVDDKVPWSAVAPSVAAAASGGNAHVTFVFAAGAPGRAAAPPASSIDAELDALATPDPAGKASKLGEEPKNGGIPGKVFKDCPAVTKDLFPKLGAAEGDKGPLVVDGLPKAITACSCKVEMAAVQRLMWSWWGRDSGTQMVGIAVDIAKVAKDGTKVTAKAGAAWSETSKAVLAAAKQGKPLTLQ